MDITAVIRMLNQMENDGAIDRYAIGGAVAATFYLEPAATMDVDVFVTVGTAPGGLLLDPQPIFDYLKDHGCTMRGEYVIIGEWPVQFLPSSPGLIDEAMSSAVEVDVEGTPARVFTAMHLAAIALQTGRAKDKARLLQFIEAGLLDLAEFKGLLSRHDLLDRWRVFEKQFG